jgi:hypothetical protein
MKKRACTDPGSRYDKALETETFKGISSEKGGRPSDIDKTSLPPCTSENICCKPCIISKKPYLKIHLPESKAPKKQPEEIPDGWKWGEWGEER